MQLYDVYFFHNINSERVLLPYVLEKSHIILHRAQVTRNSANFWFDKDTHVLNKTNTYLFIMFSFQYRVIDLPFYEFRMTMRTECWVNDERFVNGVWTHGERTLNALWTVNAERKTVNDERMMSTRWMHGELTVSELWTNAKMGK